MSSLDFPVDLVYTWVDSNDPGWLSRHHNILARNGIIRPQDSERFNSKDELRYSLRSVEKYMPWIRHIFIVTDGQTPKWLNSECDQVSIVDHDVLLRKDATLPTFNSVAIESCLHKIKGLSEHYIYFNDDIMIGRPMEKTDFYHSSGKPYSLVFNSDLIKNKNVIYRLLPRFLRHLQEFGIRAKLKAKGNHIKDFSHSIKHTQCILIKKLGENLPFYKTKHTPIPMTIHMAKEIEKLFISEYIESRSHQFRAKNDLFFPELFATAGTLKRLSNELRLDKDILFYYRFGNPVNPDLAGLKPDRYMFINFNDEAGCVAEQELLQYHRAMQGLFPYHSKYETG